MLFAYTTPQLKQVLCLGHWFTTRGHFAPGGHFTMSGDIQVITVGSGGSVLLLAGG